jgi:hypothetical protein
VRLRDLGACQGTRRALDWQQVGVDWVGPTPDRSSEHGPATPAPATSICKLVVGRAKYDDIVERFEAKGPVVSMVNLELVYCRAPAPPEAPPLASVSRIGQPGSSDTFPRLRGLGYVRYVSRRMAASS